MTNQPKPSRASLIEALVEKVVPLDVDKSEYLGLAIGVGVLAWQWWRRRENTPA